MSYYPSPQPVVYSSSSHGHGYPSSSHGHGYPYAASPGYFPSQQQQQPYYLSSPSSRSHRSHSRHHTPSYPAVVYSDSSRSHRHRSHSRPSHSHHHHHSSSHHSHHLTLGQRILRFFGLRSRHRHSSSHHYPSKGWNFFGGRRRRDRYMDPQTGREVDSRGRPIYRV